MNKAEAEQKLAESVTKKVINTIITKFTIKPIGQIAKAYYAPHVEVLTKLLVMEFKYDPKWVQITALRNAISEYRKQCQGFFEMLPPIRGKLSANPDMFYELDAVIRGGIDIALKCRDKVREVNQHLKIEKPMNLLDMVLGAGGEFTARNDLCDEVKGFIDLLDRIASYRDTWAGVQSHRKNLRLLMAQECTSTPF